MRMLLLLGLLTLVELALPGNAALAAGNDRAIAKAIEATGRWPGCIRTPLGVTRQGTRIPSLITPDDLDIASTKLRILLVGGSQGESQSLPGTLEAGEWFFREPNAQSLHSRFALSIVPIAFPDALSTSDSRPGDSTSKAVVYPPAGVAYSDPQHPEAIYLWRWIGMHAADLVVVLHPTATSTSFAAMPKQAGWAKLRQTMGADALPPGDDLASQLARDNPANVGPIPALQIPARDAASHLRKLLEAIQKVNYRELSPARRELQNRSRRTSLQIVQQLSKHYGRKLDTVAYIPALALVGQLRLGELTNDPQPREMVERVVKPYFDGSRPSLPQRVSGSHLSGHLIFSELAKSTGKDRYTELAQVAADVGFDSQGKLLEAMPHHSEMSDSVFMGTPILVAAGRLTGESKYYDMALRHMRFMLKLNLRPDGLHRHSPLDSTAWGRGNGFAALGLAWSLSDLPEDHPARKEMLTAFQQHMQALGKHQEPTGMWRQVVDHPGSYRELSSTCMITFSMLRGMRKGWLPKDTFNPIANRAFAAIAIRIGEDGRLVDVCTGTGKQKSLREYLDRKAILGPDDRGGAMALLVAAERARNEASR